MPIIERRFRIKHYYGNSFKTLMHGATVPRNKQSYGGEAEVRVILAETRLL